MLSFMFFYINIFYEYTFCHIEENQRLYPPCGFIDF